MAGDKYSHNINSIKKPGRNNAPLVFKRRYDVTMTGDCGHTLSEEIRFGNNREKEIYRNTLKQAVCGICGSIVNVTFDSMKIK